MKAGNSDFTAYLVRLADAFGENDSVDLFHLNTMDLQYCRGCWDCWWKTPGRCATNDGAEQIFRSVINSDFFMFASPLMAGFTSSALKKITDRLIVLLHPYIKIINGENHHRKRYDRYPDFGLILEKEEDTDREDVDIVKDIYDRLAINFHCNRRYMKFIEQDTIEDIIHETCHHQRLAAQEEK
jgi:hypothetical protein